MGSWHRQIMGENSCCCLGAYTTTQPSHWKQCMYTVNASFPATTEFVYGKGCVREWCADCGSGGGNYVCRCQEASQYLQGSFPAFSANVRGGTGNVHVPNCNERARCRIANALGCPPNAPDRVQRTSADNATCYTTPQSCNSVCCDSPKFVTNTSTVTASGCCNAPCDESTPTYDVIYDRLEMMGAIGIASKIFIGTPSTSYDLRLTLTVYTGTAPAFNSCFRCDAYNPERKHHYAAVSESWSWEIEDACIDGFISSTSDGVTLVSSPSYSTIPAGSHWEAIMPAGSEIQNSHQYAASFGDEVDGVTSLRHGTPTWSGLAPMSATCATDIDDGWDDDEFDAHGTQETCQCWFP